VAEQEAELAAPQPRLTKPDGAESDTVSMTRPPAGGRVSISDGPKGHWGWRNFGQFANAVRKAQTGRSIRG
jgi:hypothetical protein